jgi:hypothetical protein
MRSPHLSRCIFFSGLVLLAVARVSGQSSAGASTLNESLRAELLAMKQEDQRVRIPFGPAMTRQQQEEWRQVDARNQTRVEAIISEYGWPGNSLAGKDGSAAAWLLVQHFSPAFQEKCLPLLESAVAKGEATPRNYAYLLDRVRMHEGKAQVYGTQFRTINGITAAVPIEDPDHLDERRRAVGLGPWADYEKQILAQAAAGESRVGNPELRQEILGMVAESLRMRSGGRASLTDAMKADRAKMDAAHRQRLREIFSKYSWPTRAFIGADASARLPVIIKLQDDASFRKECLPLLEQARKSGEVSAEDYAGLADQVRLDEGRAQVYGTIPWLQGPDGKQFPAPIENPEQVDERRQSIGLEPLKKSP